MHAPLALQAGCYLKFIQWNSVIFSNPLFILKLFNYLGPLLQSIVSLTSSLRGQLVKCFMTLLPNTLINVKSFSIGIFQLLTFNVTLTNDVVSFKQLAPVTVYIVLMFS